uniref:Uncharacterized protein n=2 Tax=Caenorhabditis japonica TaxID=281687 RepID=A0A8R1DF56_CAEJA
MTPILNPWQQDQTIAKSKITNRASIRVLERYPLTDGDIEKLFDAEEMAGGDPEMLYKLCRQLVNAWTYIIYFQPKPDDLIGSFREIYYALSNSENEEKY